MSACVSIRKMFNIPCAVLICFNGRKKFREMTTVLILNWIPFAGLLTQVMAIGAPRYLGI